MMCTNCGTDTPTATCHRCGGKRNGRKTPTLLATLNAKLGGIIPTDPPAPEEDNDT